MPSPTVAASAAPTVAPSASPAAASPAAASPAASASAKPVAVGWRLAELPDANGVGQIGDVVARTGTVTAAAASGTAGDHGTAWTSLDDGATWTAGPMPGSARSVNKLVPWGDRMLAVGEGDGDCAHPSIVDIWVRSSAGSWTAAPADPIFCAGGTASAAASGPTAVIAGDGSGDVPYEWSSHDGLHWTDQSDVLAGHLPTGIAVDGTGFLAVGSGSTSALAWASRSKDGITWDAPHPIAGTAGLAIMGDPVESKGDLVIFARDAAGTVDILRPDDKGGWTLQHCKGLNGDSVSRIEAVGSSLIALGGNAQGPEMWASADGASWRALALPAEARASGSSAALTGAAVADGRAYLVGQIAAASGGGAIGALWTGSASLLAP